MTLRYSGMVAGVNNWKVPIRGGKSMALTPKYRAFLHTLEAHFRFHRQRQAMIKEPVIITGFARLPAKMDLSNITKPVFDALEHAGVIENDILIVGYSMLRGKDSPRGKCALVLEVNTPTSHPGINHHFTDLPADYSQWM